jgi:Undecaprenyl-phosphate glucose phosphotransferase
MAGRQGAAFKNVELLARNGDRTGRTAGKASPHVHARPAGGGRPGGQPAWTLSESIVSGLVRAADALILGTISVVFLALYVDPINVNYQHYAVAVAIQTAMTVGAFQYAGLYEFHTIVSWPTRMRRMLAMLALVALVLVAVAFAMQISQDFSRVWFFGSVVVAATAVGGARGLAKLIIDRLGRSGRLVRNIAIVGAGDQADHLVTNVRQHEMPWNRVIGIFDDRKTRINPEINGLPVLGDMDDLVNYVRAGKIHDVVITLPWSADQRLVSIIHRLRVLPVHIYLGSDLICYHFPRHRQEFFDGVPVMHIASAPLTGWNGLIKLLEDKLLAGMILLMFAPIMLLIGLAIKLDSPGPVFFRQKRYGFNNQLIEVWKFRSMYHHLRDDNADRLTTKRDPRVTRVGAFLRRTSLDELPQLINVLRGDMSIVGPRPHAIKAKAGGRLYEEVVAEYAVRHKVKPGLTGWAQVNGWRGETEVEEQIIKRVEHDLYYIENWSLWLDIKILLMTTIYGWSGSRAY